MKRKDRGLCPCINYRGPNKVTVKFWYLLPLVPTTLEQLRTTKYCTKLDLSSTYNRIHIREGSEEKMAFSTALGHYEYLVMLFGLVNSQTSVISLVICKIDGSEYILMTTSFARTPSKNMSDMSVPFSSA
ncbi:hypothetical protein H4Q32_018903 [Labeo rohita]|uniref:ribonuclease H n=1 Tax=Labeo rohita TaxID=84645 RepID=A0ABQ8LLT2_LABRO|nr:hypothetical protein H4Q32_018903 [Labeo rohita]